MTSAAPVEIATVPRLWPGSTIVCIASGPSLTPADVEYCRDRAPVIAIKDVIRLAPWADVLYACDAKWWKHHRPDFVGPRYSLETAAKDQATVLRNTGMTGLDTDPTGVRTGKNSGYQAINVAVHFGAAKIILLGYDMQAEKGQHHWFGRHPYWAADPPYHAFLQCFDTIVEPLRALGVTVLNATRRSALTAFPSVSIEEALA